eukprot:CAMPEP_0197850550 /NCGR_PEP_ID=MMETSP1438-20131217/15688_1 /TAXON_ID=1461541 /ORGANISM="Pterosperma sp., Strain CCMP1384" /LENGTH=293 /DNA_ID=CAMNT_0043463765 /DNA_START=122 /DNA_END=999 /DNA_ORIENTATION=+
MTISCPEHTACFAKIPSPPHRSNKVIATGRKAFAKSPTHGATFRCSSPAALCLRLKQGHRIQNRAFLARSSTLPVESFDEDLDEVIQESKAQSSSAVLEGVSFSVSGFLFSYYCGVVDCLTESGHLVLGETELAGSSGGGIISALATAGVDMDTVIDGQKRMYELLLNDDSLEVQHALYELLDEIMPSDASEIVTNAPTRVAVTRVWPPPFPLMVSEFTDKDDLIGAVIAGCYGGFGFTGNAPFRQWRGSPCIDGGSAVSLHHLQPPLLCTTRTPRNNIVPITSTLKTSQTPP